jgi:hypothetical protein
VRVRAVVRDTRVCADNRRVIETLFSVAGSADAGVEFWYDTYTHARARADNAVSRYLTRVHRSMTPVAFVKKYFGNVPAAVAERDRMLRYLQQVCERARARATARRRACARRCSPPPTKLTRPR